MKYAVPNTSAAAPATQPDLKHHNGGWGCQVLRPEDLDEGLQHTRAEPADSTQKHLRNTRAVAATEAVCEGGSCEHVAVNLCCVCIGIQQPIPQHHTTRA